MAVFVLLSGLLLGCGVAVSQSDPVLCNAAHDVSLAITVTTDASAKDSAGDRVGAQQLASQARTRAEQGHDKLQAITSEGVRAGTTWQSLLEAYLHAGQAANALLPGFEGTYGITEDELASARRALQAAAVALPAECTKIRATPASTSA
jgi:hypothetical protein